MTIRASIQVAGKTIFNNGNDSIYKNLTKMMNRRMFTLPDAATMPGDMVWRRYKDAFIRTEKAFLGTSRIEGIEDLLDTAAGMTEGEAASIKSAIDMMGSGKNGNGILDEGMLQEGSGTHHRRCDADTQLMGAFGRQGIVLPEEAE